jgi:hypothetical protein
VRFGNLPARGQVRCRQAVSGTWDPTLWLG